MPSPRFARAFNAAVAASERGDLKSARNHFKKALKDAPHHAVVLHHLGLISQQLGDMDASVRYLKRAVTADPADAVVLNNLGNVLLARGDAEGAADAYRKSVSIKPDYVNGLFNLAKLQIRAGELKTGIETWRKILNLAPTDLEVRNELGVALIRDNKHEQAAEMFRSALAIDPEHTESHNSLGVYYMHKGDLEQARACFMEVLKRDPNHARAHENLVRSRRFSADDKATIDHLENLVKVESSSDDDRMLYRFSLGKIYDDCGDAKNAFQHYREGNALRQRTARFDADAHSVWVDRVIQTFTANFFAARRDHGTSSDLPVFIVGMIRSGTTLVEQIIASHPDVVGAGELLHVSDMTRTLPRRLGSNREFPECVTDLSSGHSRELGEYYIEQLRELDSGARRITDKLPTNFLFLGLIALILPRARVIHCLRDPLDVAVSIYFQRFAEGHEYAYSLSDIAAYYREYVRLMKHWKKVLPIAVHEVKYESLIADQEIQSRALIQHCGLEWNDACLQFNETERMVSTASNWQVRQPVYRSSLAKWRRYEAFLGPLKSLLDESTDFDKMGNKSA